MCVEGAERSLLSVIHDSLIRNDQYLQRYVEVAYLEYRTVSDVHNVSVRHETHCGAIRSLTRPKLFTHRELQMMMLAGACFICVTDGRDRRGFLSGFRFDGFRSFAMLDNDTPSINNTTQEHLVI